MPTRTLTFESIYRQNYAVIEERHGNVRLYPHTDQLNVILRAVRREFRRSLPADIASTNCNSPDLDKFVLRSVMRMYCNFINASRSDELLFYPIFDQNLVSRLACVQTITEHTTRGPIKHFKFYAGPDFYQEIYLAGRRLMFVDHCIDRYLERIPPSYGMGLADFIDSYFSKPYLALDCNNASAFVRPTLNGSVIVNPFQDTGSEFILLTTLGVAETASLRCSLPVHHLYLSYNREATRHSVIHENVRETVEYLINQWRIGVWGEPYPDRLPEDLATNDGWVRVASSLRAIWRVMYGSDFVLEFCGGVVGPCARHGRPSQQVPYDELADYAQICPGHDWRAILATRDSNSYRLDHTKISIPYQPTFDSELISDEDHELDPLLREAIDEIYGEERSVSQVAETSSNEVITNLPPHSETTSNKPSYKYINPNDQETETEEG